MDMKALKMLRLVSLLPNLWGIIMLKKKTVSTKMLYAFGVEVVLKKMLLWQTLMPRAQDGFAKRKVHSHKILNQHEYSL